jgi:hypothetical protein
MAFSIRGSAANKFPNIRAKVAPPPYGLLHPLVAAKIADSETSNRAFSRSREKGLELLGDGADCGRFQPPLLLQAHSRA